MGLGASPILAGGSIILLADQRGESYIAAFDSRNGEIRWKAPREEFESWGTPLIYNPAGAQPQILTASRGQFGAHRLADGKRTASQQGVAQTIVASPVLDHDTFFVFGYGSEATSPFSEPLKKYDKNNDGQTTPDEYGANSVMNAIGRYVGNRDRIITKAKWDEWERMVIGPSRLIAIHLEQDPTAPNSLRPRELWRYDKSFTGVIPSPLLYQGVLYIVRNGGILTSFDPETGSVLKASRIPGALGGYSSSPVAAEGKLFIASEDGKVAVLRAGKEWEVLTVNALGEG